MKQHIKYIDLAKGICICLVVLYHVTLIFDLPEHSIRTSEWGFALKAFRMPLYFFLSGLFFKTYGSFKNFTIKKTNKLLVPFISFYLIGCCPWKLWAVIKDPSILTDINKILYQLKILYPSEAIWFLWCLFLVGIFFYFISSKIKNTLGLILSSVVIGYLGYTLNNLNIHLPFNIDSAMSALPFYCIGNVINKRTNFLHEKNKYKSAFNLTISLILLFTIIFNTGVKEIDYHYNYYTISFPLLLISGISGTILICSFSQIVEKVPIISYVGKYSIVILCTHYVLLHGIRLIVNKIEVSQNITSSEWYPYIIFIVCILISLPIIKYGIKFCPIIFAQKDLFGSDRNIIKDVSNSINQKI